MSENFIVSCPECRTQFEVAGEDLGKSAECPQCGTLFVMTAEQTTPQENFTTRCPECGSSFDLPAEYEGQTAECPNCSKSFQMKRFSDAEKIPEEFEAAPESVEQTSVPEAPKEEKTTGTNTVRISRKAIGMLPKTPDFREQFFAKSATSDELAAMQENKQKKSWWKFK